MIQDSLRCWAAFAVIVAVAALGVADETATPSPSPMPGGLEAYLEARILEANGSYREAMEAYEQAVREAPDVGEIRIAFAGFLVDLGLADRAVGLLDGFEGLEPEGLRIKALAMAQQSTRDETLVAGAEEALREAVESDSDDPNLLFSLAQLLIRQGKLAEAEPIVDGLREERPNNQRLVKMHADLLHDLERNEDAVALYAQCADSGPAVQSCRERLVNTLIALDRPGEAGEMMLGWLRDVDLDSLMRSAALLWEGGRLQLSLDTVQRVLARAPDSPRARALEAHLLSALGRHPEAVERLQRLLKKSPDDLDLILALAWSLSRTGELDKARRWLDRGWEQVQSDAGSSQAVRCALTAARLELVAENPMVARSWLDRVGDYSIAGTDYVRLLAGTYRSQQQWRDGISAMVRVQPHLQGRAQTEAEAMEAEFRLHLDDPRAWRRLRPLLDSQDPAEVLLGLQVLQSLEMWSEVEQSTTAALERFPDNRNLLFSRAAALERLEDHQAAEALFRELVESDPNDANAANYLGYMWAERNVQLDEALELITRAVSLDPENVAYLDSLGWVHYRRGDLKEAERWLRRAVDLGGNLGDGTIYCHLGEVLLAVGERDEGRRYLLLGLDMGCEEPEHVRSLLDGSDDGD